MSVADQLGLWDETSELLALADQRWGHWASAYPALTRCCGVCDLRSWLPGADKADADEALHALATLAATDGGDDIAAAAALAWALMPGACTLANRLRTLTWHIDEVVAAQLWVEVRTFAWRRLRKVAATVLLNTRAGVLRDCGAKSQLRRTDLTWSWTSPYDPLSSFWRRYAFTHCEPPTRPGEEELLELLEWACKNKVITGNDRALLLCLVEAADSAATGRVGGRTGGLLANSVSEVVAQKFGIAPSTVRRRAHRSINALSRACTPAGGRDSGMNGERRGPRTRLRSIEVMNMTQTGHMPDDETNRPTAEIARLFDVASREDEAIRLLDGGMTRLHEVQQAKAELKGLTARELKAALELRHQRLGGEPA